ncbi:MAG: hypothetical protein AAFR63_03200 [Cyanobacteria bacterium J06631_6]
MNPWILRVIPCSYPSLLGRAIASGYVCSRSRQSPQTIESDFSRNSAEHGIVALVD